MGFELVYETEDKVRQIQDHLKAAFDRQKYYTDLKRCDIEYSLVRSIAYQLELPPELGLIYDVFHVLMLKGYWSGLSHVVSVEEIEVRPDLTFEEKLIQILDRDIKVLRRKSILLVKVLWQNHGTEEATWKFEASIHQQCPHMFGSDYCCFTHSTIAATIFSFVNWFGNLNDSQYIVVIVEFSGVGEYGETMVVTPTV
ncbi:uncharacterized protein LOC108462383 [Gossypium arboreum]|uniref:uncharacterized protein LOC108462383 n=1 Tax=Gossypium arboreum TaxID=29729 RepID=UPI0008195114|nr:uncharacterized protein LOC108462383 [Gossypium arboreum]